MQVQVPCSPSEEGKEHGGKPAARDSSNRTASRPSHGEEKAHSVPCQASHGCKSLTFPLCTPRPWTWCAPPAPELRSAGGWNDPLLHPDSPSSGVQPQNSQIPLAEMLCGVFGVHPPFLEQEMNLSSFLPLLLLPPPPAPLLPPHAACL